MTTIDHSNIPAGHLEIARSNARLDPDGQVYPWRSGYPLIGQTVYHAGYLWTVASKEFGPGELELTAIVRMVGVGHDSVSVATRGEVRPVLWTQDDEDRLLAAELGADPVAVLGDDTTTAPYLLQIRLSDLECAAKSWAAACSTAGAAAPDHVATALIALGGDLVRAAIEGTRAAEEAHRVDQANGWGGPEPRGLSLDIAGGKATWIVWDTETSSVRIGPSRDGWVLRISTATRSHRRVRSALVSAWRWREPEDHAAILTAATESGISRAELDAAAVADPLQGYSPDEIVVGPGGQTIADEIAAMPPDLRAVAERVSDMPEVDPDPGYEQRAVDRARRDGVLP